MARLPDPLSLDLIIEYLQGCPLVIHFPVEKVMGLFLKDDQYRNQFETGESRFGGSTGRRAVWETSMFGDAYAAAAPSVRPKYGAVNYDRDPLGDKRARDLYGEGHLVLQNVQDRVTYTCGDSAQLLQHKGISKSGGARETIAFGVWMARIVAQLTAQDLKLLTRLASGTSPDGEVCLSIYLEFQIHGAVRFLEDVSKIVVPVCNKLWFPPHCPPPFA